MIGTLARLVAPGLLLAAAAAQAQYLNTLGASPVSQFGEADYKLMLATIDKALADPADGTTLAWKNEASPAAGSVTVQKSFEADGRKCRNVLVANSWKTLKGEGMHTFCQDGAGKWTLKQ